MKKINFVNGTTIDGASTFNQMQNNVEEVFNGEEAMGSIVVEDVRSANLLNAEACTNTEITGTPNSTRLRTDYIEVKDNITISFDRTDDLYCIAIYYQEIGGTYTNGSWFTEATTISSETAKYVRFLFKRGAGGGLDTTSSMMKTSKVMVNEGTTPLPYSEYKKFGYNSQESMGKIVVDDISGKNKWILPETQTLNGVTFTNNGDGTFNLVGTATADTEFKIDVNLTQTGLELDKIYTISCNVERANFRSQVALYNGNTLVSTPITLSTYEGEQSKTAVLNSKNTTVNKVTFYVITWGGASVNLTNVKMQLEKGDKVSEWSPRKEFSNLQHYSTNEQVVGTWTDGRPLYEKTYETTSTTVNLSAEPYDLLFVHEAIIELTTGATFTMGRYMNSTDFFTTYAYKNNNIVSIDLGSNWIMSKGFITVRYTKTTDIGTSTSSISTTSLEESE